jgi:hypothetical protein
MVVQMRCGEYYVLGIDLADTIRPHEFAMAIPYDSPDRMVCQYAIANKREAMGRTTGHAAFSHNG